MYTFKNPNHFLHIFFEFFRKCIQVFYIIASPPLILKYFILYDCIIYQIRVTFRGTIDYNISFIQKQYLIFRLIPFSGSKYCTIIYIDILTNVTNM